MADYSQTPNRPNIKPTGVPPADVPVYTPEPRGWGTTAVLGAVAVVGIVALVAWGVIDNGSADGPSSVDVDVQSAPATTGAEPAAPTTVPDASVTPGEPVTPGETETPDPVVTPEPVPQEVPEPAPESAPVPVPPATPAPTN